MATRTRSPRRNTVGQGALLKKGIDLDELGMSNSNDENEEVPFASKSEPLDISDQECMKRDITPPRRSIYNRQLTPTKSAMKNPKLNKQKSKRKGLRKSVSFSRINLEIPPEEHADEEEPDNKEESEQAEKDDSENKKDEEDSKSAPLRRAASSDGVTRSASPALRRTMSTGSAVASGGEAPVKRITRPKMDPAERKARREAALKEAKAAAKSVQKQNSMRGGFNTTSEQPAAAAAAPKKKGLFGKVFRRSKSLDLETAKAAMSTEIAAEQQDKAKKKKAAAKEQSAESKADLSPKRSSRSSRIGRLSNPSVAPPAEEKVAAPAPARAPPAPAPPAPAPAPPKEQAPEKRAPASVEC